MRKAQVPIYEIALRSGFRFRDYFSKVFKKAEGITPRKNRLKYQDTGAKHLF